MERRLQRLRRLPATLLIVGVAIVVTWVTASMALSDLRPDVLAADLSSSLKADYGVSRDDMATLSPIDETIVESVTRDERERGASQIGFAPIYLAGEGNQEPVRLPSGEVEPAPAPSPTALPGATQPGSPTSESTPKPRPTQPGNPTPGPKPTQPDHPTPAPQPTQPEQPTQKPKPTQPEQPTPKPKPTQPEQPTPKPKPTQPDNPTPEPHPTHNSA
jgi:hypothetical protein